MTGIIDSHPLVNNSGTGAMSQAWGRVSFARWGACWLSLRETEMKQDNRGRSRGAGTKGPAVRALSAQPGPPLTVLGGPRDLFK